MSTMTHAEFLAEATNRFGEDATQWAFVCPACGDVATGADFETALLAHPRTNVHGQAQTYRGLLGQECIGRIYGAIRFDPKEWAEMVAAGEARGCEWTAYGLYEGPLRVETSGGGGIVHCFELAEARR